MTLFPRPSPLGRKRKHESLKSNADNYLNLEYLHVDADILIVFVQDVLKLVHVWNLNIVEHRNIVLENNLVVGTQLWMDKCISIRFVSPPTVLFEQKHRYWDADSQVISL